MAKHRNSQRPKMLAIKLIKEMSQRDFNARDVKDKLQSLSNEIDYIAQYPVIVQHTTIEGKDADFFIHSNATTTPDHLKHSTNLHSCGAVTTKIIVNGMYGEIRCTKTTLFNALLMISSPNAELIALKMMQLHPGGKFHSLGVDQTPALALLMQSSKGTIKHLIANELIKRESFHLDTVELDVFTDKKTSILEHLVCSKNHDLLSLMIETGLYNFNALTKVYCFSVFETATPLMLFAQSGDIKAVKILVEAGVNVNLTIDHSQMSIKASAKMLYNALSFARNNMEIAEYLIENGSDYHNTTVGLMQNMSFGLSKAMQYSIDMQNLLANQVYYEQSTKLMNLIASLDAEGLKAEEAKEEKVEVGVDFNDIMEQVATLNQKRQDTLNELKQQESTKGIEDLEILLLEYFVTKNEESAQQIRDLCKKSSEIALKLISSLNHNYFDNLDVVVGNFISDPKLIHRYFQERKALTQEKIKQLHNVDQSNSVQSWQVGDECLNINDVISVKTTMHSNIYIKIADDIIGSVPKGGLDNLKLISINSLGVNGIKFRKDLGIVTLKTKALGDDRLIAQEMHKNSNDNILIIFTDICNHTKVNNWSKAVPGGACEHALQDQSVLNDCLVDGLDQNENGQVVVLGDD